MSAHELDDLEPADVRHVEVEHEHVEGREGEPLDGFEPRGGLGDGEGRIGAQTRADHVAHHLAVVYDEDLGHGPERRPTKQEDPPRIPRGRVAICPNGEEAGRQGPARVRRWLRMPNQRGRVWIVEDSPLEAEMTRRALGHHDIEVFSDGSAVLERVATSFLPDAIVLDWHMPGVTGVEVCRVIRANHEQMVLPVLMLTSQDHRDDIVEALGAGANDYVTKPYDMTELVARVGTLVRTARLTRVQARRARQLALSAEIGATLTNSRPSEMASRCAEIIGKHLDAEAVGIWGARDGRFELIAGGLAGIPLALVEQVGVGGKSVITDEPIVKGALGFMALPLRVRNETIGVVACATHAPLAEDADAMNTLADLIAVGLDRNRLDVDRLAILERERAARADAEAANRSKDEFIAMVSHELRTPLNAIKGWTTMLMGGSLDAVRTQRALETIDRNARSQAQLIDDLLDIARIISGQLRLEPSLLHIASIAEMALESVRLAADARGVKLLAQIEPLVGELTGDADRIQQVIWNLLSNAIKFTPKGGTVQLAVHRHDAAIHIVVNDTGQGIDPAFLPHVFERFKQADSTTTRQKGGLGLGLAIVRHLVELHGGSITATSEGLGTGSTFEVLLPTQARKDQDPDRTSVRIAARPPLERPREMEGLRILVVDDEPDSLDLMRALLESCNVVVTTASNAADAFAELRRAPPDVLVSDIAMPDEDGLSLIRRVRLLPREEGGRVPSVAVSAYARLEDRTRALRAGFNSHVAKPVEASELLAVLSSLVTSR